MGGGRHSHSIKAFGSFAIASFDLNIFTALICVASHR